MKKLFFIAILIVSYNCKAQNILDISSITVNGYKTNNISKSNIIIKFGQPLKIEEDFSEMDNKKMYIYVYKGAKFFTFEDHLDAFEIYNSTFKVTSNEIKIDDYISSLEKIYPISYAEKSEKHLALGIKENDKYLSIHFDEITKRIKLIRFGNY